MKKYKGNLEGKNSYSKAKTEKGAALVIVILVMLLLMGFVVVVLSRVNSETVITANDAAENRSFNAAQALVESNSQDFATLFQRKLAPTTTDIDTIRNASITGFDDYDFSRKFVTQKKDSESIQIPDGDYAGLFSIRDEWEIDVTARDLNTGVESRVKRSFNNDRIPLFQFGMFYEDDLELNRPPLFTFGGRVHTNANLFISANKIIDNPPSGGIYFNSKATVVGEVVNDIWKFGTALSAGTDDQNGVKFADSGGTYRELLTGKGSVKCVNPSGANVFASKPNLPNCSNRPDWYTTDKLVFQGNLDNHKPRLNLPLYRLGVNLVELVKRGKNVGDSVTNGTANPAVVTAAMADDPVLSFERFANKPGIRISLADARNRLPGCASVVGPDPNNNLCGVRLDLNGGYQPRPMTDNAVYRTTRLNATRFAQQNKEMWIKIEIVNYDYDAGVPVTTDITEDILSLGVTESAPFTNDFQIAGHTQNGVSNTSFNDSRSIIKLQRFTIPGVTIPNAAGAKYLSNRSIGGANHNLVLRYTTVTPIPAVPVAVIAPPTGCNTATGTPSDIFSAPPPSPQFAANSADERNNHLYCVRFANTAISSYTNTITPFPIQLFDTREGIVQDRPGTNNSVPGTDSFGNDNVTRAGAMSMIDIDVSNLRKFLNGGANSFDGLFPTNTRFANSFVPARGLQSSDIPQNKGWVVYVSDRRGDADFDGEYDMEDVISDGVQQFNEDINGNGVFNPGNGVFERAFFDLNNNFFEAPRYNETLTKSQAATTDHGYFRRGVRLINGGVLPGSYNRLNPTQTKGFTFASENGVYVKGNYNAESVTLTGTTAPAPPQNYFPQGGTPAQAGSANATNHVPAAIVSDAAMILSNAWNDSQSFAFPFAQESRVATPTVMRFALLTGDVITGKNGTTTVSPSATGGLGNGGVHNFKRYLEVWTNVRLNYTGSLVNLFNSRNNNSFFKCCEAVYNPPIRDWSFDTTFLDPNRLPPGTPYIYSMSLTGFQRVNE